MLRWKLLAGLVLILFMAPKAFCENVSSQKPDVVFCDSQTAEVPSGFYVIEYLRQLEKSKITIPKDWIPLKQRWRFWGIASFFEENLFFDLTNDLIQYSDGILNPDATSLNHGWEEAPFGFGEFPVSSLPLGLQSICRGSNTKAFLAIRRGFRGTKRMYEYDPKLIAHFESDDGVQLTWLLLQKWFENYSINDEYIRDLMLPMMQGRPEEAKNQAPLIRRVLYAHDSANTTFCNRSRAMVKSLEVHLKNRCDYILPEDLNSITSFKIVDIRAPGEVISLNEFEFRIFDFFGLNNLKTLDMTHLPWLGTSLRSGMFQELGSLKEIDFTGSTLYGMWPDLFYKVNQLEKLTFNSDIFSGRQNKIEVAPFRDVFTKDSAKNPTLILNNFTGKDLDYGLLHGLQSLVRLEISDFYNRKIPAGAFRDLKNLKVLKVNTFNSTPLEQINGNLNEEFLPLLEELAFEARFDQISKLPRLKKLITHSNLLEDGFDEKFPLLEELIMDANFFVFPNFPVSLKNLNHLKRIRANNLFNIDTSEGWGRRFDNLPSSLEVFEFCMPRQDLNFGRFVAQEIHRTNPKVKIRTRAFCKGEAHEF